MPVKKLEASFSSVERWSNIGYISENRTRMIVGVKENLTSLSALEKLVAKHQAKLVNKVFVKNRVIAVVVEIPIQTSAA
ncbi:hypothetical protein KEJ32_02780, partial [Candidatus Bathyarchaeota archaeon]|nr:hypothetical protein [Candidatus Bathyarchaeota archaeon]